MESAYCGKDKGKWTRDWKGKEMKGVQRGKHEELEKVDGKVRLTRVRTRKRIRREKKGLDPPFPSDSAFDPPVPMPALPPLYPRLLVLLPVT
jgi:hypothetical protein